MGVQEEYRDGVSASTIPAAMSPESHKYFYIICEETLHIGPLSQRIAKDINEPNWKAVAYFAPKRLDPGACTAGPLQRGK